MLRFLFGVFLGAAAYWAYESGMLPFGKPDALDQASQTDSQIIRPTPQEISGRPTEPIPS